MNFTSFEFLAFLPIVWCVYWMLNRHGAVRLTERVRQDVERLYPRVWK